MFRVDQPDKQQGQRKWQEGPHNQDDLYVYSSYEVLMQQKCNENNQRGLLTREPAQSSRGRGLRAPG